MKKVMGTQGKIARERIRSTKTRRMIGLLWAHGLSNPYKVKAKLLGTCLFYHVVLISLGKKANSLGI